MNRTGKGFLLGLAVSVLILVSAVGGALADRLFVIKPLDNWLNRDEKELALDEQVKVVEEENLVVAAVERNEQAVVTVTAVGQTRGGIVFDPFNLLGLGIKEGEAETVEEDIGTGFVVDKEEGLVVTNRHVVSQSGLEYKVIGYDGSEYKVVNMYKDPVNDIAILQIEGEGELNEVVLGDSSNLKVGQRVVAIGTALGEFRQTVTSGVISGLGRGIEAGDSLAGYVERIDDVIQTDAAINPGNSGGPLLNSVGEVIGVNVAVVNGAENVGFAIPINTIKESLSNFEETGRFNRAVLGVSYKLIDEEVALLNEVPAGAYIVEVKEGSVAEETGLERGEIIVEMSGERVVSADGGLAGLIGSYKPGDKVELLVWNRDEGERQVNVSLGSSVD